MKKNIFLRIGAIVMITALCTTCILSGTTTLAKYASFASGTATSQIAKWQVKVNGYDFSAAGDNGPISSFNLFDTILDTLDGLNEDHVLQASGKAARIAPGTKGSFDLTLENASEVTVAFTVELATSLSPSPFTLTGGPGGTVEVAPNTTVAYTAASSSAFEWVWAYEDGTSGTLNTSGTTLGNTAGWTNDTSIGINNSGNLTATLNVYAIQVD